MKIKNLLHQPLELDFGKESFRFNSRETKSIPSKYKDHPALKRNGEAIQVFEDKPLAQPKKLKQKAIDVKEEN